MSQTIICPNCQSVHTADKSQGRDQADVRCEKCGTPLAVRSAAVVTPQPAKILWIDDDRLLLSFGKDALEQYGYRLFIANDGPAGIATAKKERPDLIIVDVIMPAMDGYEVCRRLRAEPGLKDIPIILLTVLEDPNVGVSGGEAGAIFTMSKPARPERIISVIESILSRKRDLPKL